jgi:hypothetical protein
VRRYWQPTPVDAVLKPGRDFYDRCAKVQEMTFAGFSDLIGHRGFEEVPLVRDLYPAGHMVL